MLPGDSPSHSSCAIPGAELTRTQLCGRPLADSSATQSLLFPPSSSSSSSCGFSEREMTHSGAWFGFRIPFIPRPLSPPLPF
ncbi:hypothetical protein NPIL_502681 [Nephila pilipes]|uniref:Uncharacterized protein n=1 Tax=Nephila pilipes TaxID=299642 RepID=A0A8X6UBF5_NEPPI|nr:hypothetical protein NPIL_502681 [Nephila pilipes]